MEVEGGGDESVGGGEGGSELSELSPGDEGEDGGAEPAEELPPSCEEPSSRTSSEPRAGLREGRADRGC
jgi:hypothetical protein